MKKPLYVCFVALAFTNVLAANRWDDEITAKGGTFVSLDAQEIMFECSARLDRGAASPVLEEHAKGNIYIETDRKGRIARLDFLNWSVPDYNLSTSTSGIAGDKYVYPVRACIEGKPSYCPYHNEIRIAKMPKGGFGFYLTAEAMLADYVTERASAAGWFDLKDMKWPSGYSVYPRLEFEFISVLSNSDGTVPEFRGVIVSRTDTRYSAPWFYGRLRSCEITSLRNYLPVPFK